MRKDKLLRHNASRGSSTVQPLCQRKVNKVKSDAVKTGISGEKPNFTSGQKFKP